MGDSCRLLEALDPGGRRRALDWLAAVLLKEGEDS